MTDETRIGQLERETARFDQRLSGVERQVRDLTPLSTALVRVEGAVNTVKEDVADVRKQIQQRGEQERSLRIALIGLSGTILVTLIGSIVTVFATGAHP